MGLAEGYSGQLWQTSPVITGVALKEKPMLHVVMHEI